MSLDKQILINQATPDTYIAELQSSNPKLYRAIKNIGDVLKVIINLTVNVTVVNKYTADFSAAALTPLVITHSLGTSDIIVSFYDSTGNLLIPDTLIVSAMKAIVTFTSTQTGRVVIIK